jgi:hypothetical protein
MPFQWSYQFHSEAEACVSSSSLEFDHERIMLSGLVISVSKPPLWSSVQSSWLQIQRVSRGQRNGSPRPLIRLSWPEPLLFPSSSSSVILTSLSGPRTRPNTSHKILSRGKSNPGPLYLSPGTLTTRPQRRGIYIWRTNYDMYTDIT